MHLLDSFARRRPDGRHVRSRQHRGTTRSHSVPHQPSDPADKGIHSADQSSTYLRFAVPLRRRARLNFSIQFGQSGVRIRQSRLPRWALDHARPPSSRGDEVRERRDFGITPEQQLICGYGQFPSVFSPAMSTKLLAGSVPTCNSLKMNPSFETAHRNWPTA